MPWYKSSKSSPDGPPSPTDPARGVRSVGLVIVIVGLLWSIAAISPPLSVWKYYPDCTTAQMLAIVGRRFAAGPLWIIVVGFAIALRSAWIAALLARRFPRR